MIKRIIIEPVPFETHETMDESLTAAQSAKQKRIKEIDAVVGLTVSSYKFSGDQLCLNLSCGNALIIGAGKRGVWWCSAEHAENVMSVHFPSVIELVFSSADSIEPETYLWKWRNLLDSVVGNTITSVQPSDGILYLSIEKQDDLTFVSNTLVGDTNGFFLFFCPDD